MGGTFFAPGFTLTQFGVRYGPQTACLAYVVAGGLLFASLVAAGATLRGITYLGWWIGIGIGNYYVCGKPDNLLLDSVKGLFIVLLTRRC
ncbi:hypothetical protein [Hymenobacter montanus]|uniref:hypothetical protein n=1 Tax=Hymenobacter montanus TaxID=2771359 RepID=UPI001CC2B223|nr:hypothetical protein [Hymenobacter montanus]